MLIDFARHVTKYSIVFQLDNSIYKTYTSQFRKSNIDQLVILDIVIKIF